MMEQLFVVAFFAGVGVLGIYQYRKTVRLRRAYEALSPSEKKLLNLKHWNDPRFVAYSRPMTTSMWFSAGIGILIFIWVLVDNAGL